MDKQKLKEDIKDVVKLSSLFIGINLLILLLWQLPHFYFSDFWRFCFRAITFGIVVLCGWATLSQWNDGRGVSRTDLITAILVVPITIYTHMNIY